MLRYRFSIQLLVLALCAISVWSACSPGVFADGVQLERLQAQIFQVVDHASPAIVEIRRRGSIFSGVIVSPEGHVLTAGHTIVPGQQCTVTLPDGRRFDGEALGASEQMRGERLDCGLIRIHTAESLPFVPLGSSANLRSMQPCLSISYPGGQRKRGQPVVRFGWINRSSRSGRMIQSTALMEPGDSGGPLLDLDGRLIGIHSRIGTRVDQNYDVPIDAFKKHWDALNVAQTFSSQNGKTIPRLGFIGRDDPQGQGITVLSVIQGSLAEQLGLKPNDVLTKLQDQSLTGLRDLHANLLDAVQNQTDQGQPEPLSLAIRRGQDQLEYLLPTDQLLLPPADRIVGLDDDDSTESTWDYPEWDWNEFLAGLQTEPNDAVVKVTSQVGEQQIGVTATRLLATPFLISKSSRVGIQPRLADYDQPVDLAIVARCSERDLVLLQSTEINSSGVQIPEVTSSSSSRLEGEGLPRPGQFLWSPQVDGSVLVSISGSEPFSSARAESRGYLGVILRDHESGGVVLLEVDDGAAKRAGLEPGDVIVQMEESAIKIRSDMLRFLGTVDPATTVLATVRRGSEEFEAPITLGTFPEFSSHAADRIEKSMRRDGFPLVFCHDADIKPEGCGGPVIDSQGNWVAINIARYSRVRSFAIPIDAVVAFLEPHVSEMPK